MRESNISTFGATYLVLWRFEKLIRCENDFPVLTQCADLLKSFSIKFKDIVPFLQVFVVASGAFKISILIVYQ
jgi:hypothetical protein